MDRLFEYVNSEGIPQNIIEKAALWLVEQGFDTDSIKLDANKMTVKKQDSSIASHIKHIPLRNALTEFVENIKGTFLPTEFG